MKKSILKSKESTISKFYLKTLILLTLMFSAFEIEAQHTWGYLGDFKSFTGLYDSQHFVVEQSSDIYKYTSDGGATFQDVGLSLPSTSHFISVEYLDPSTLRGVVFTGGSYDLYESTDGGANFTFLSTITPPDMYPLHQAPQMVSFDDSESLLSCKVLYNSELFYVLFRTVDGGSTWNLATADTFAFENLYDMEIYKNGSVVAASNNPQGIEVSNDRGQTFTPTLNNPPLNSSMEIAYDGNQYIWATGIIGSQNERAYYSSDGGDTWNAWNVFSDADEVKYTNPSNVMIFGSDDTTAISTDNGITFNTVSFPADKPTTSILRLAFGDDQETYYCYDLNFNVWVLPAEGNVGLSNISNDSQINVYPNPAKNQITIDSYQGEVEIYDMVGQLVKTKTIAYNEVVDISDLPTGLLILKIKNKVVKIVKQ